MRTGDYLRTIGKLYVLGDKLEDVGIVLNTYVEVDTVGVEYVR